MGYLITFYFIVLDFFTGLLKAFATDSFSSKIMRRGLFHKLSLLCVMALGWLMEYAQRFVDLGLSFAVPVGTAACVYIILMEVGSILENLCEANPELMPDKLCQLFGVGTRLENTEEEEAKKQLPMEEETAQAEEAEPHENQ
jgi:phage-related holin